MSARIGSIFTRLDPHFEYVETAEAHLLTGVIALVGAVCFLAFTVYPFPYGGVESAALVGLLVVAALVETVLDDAGF